MMRRWQRHHSSSEHMIAHRFAAPICCNPDKPVVKRFRHGVIGKIAEALIFPERIRRSGKQVLASAPATQFRDMDVIDPIFAQRLRQAIPIELRVGS